MSRLRIKSNALAVAVPTCVVGILLLTGCEPTGNASTGGCDPHGVAAFQPAHCQAGDKQAEPASHDTGDGSQGCDPHGFGPLSGCNGGSGDDGPSWDNDESDSGGPLPKSFYWRARHEAGHKNCAEEFGMNVTKVWLHPDGEGRTYVSGFRFKGPQQRLVVVYCGAVAAGTTEGTEGESSDGAPSDNDQTREILRKYPVDDTSAQAEAQRIVSKRSAQIDRDATELLARGKL